tara:strand:- start:612 stop:998 length:387 start_codon:yes stop_codon:yes gene_type:complete
MKLFLCFVKFFVALQVILIIFINAVFAENNIDEKVKEISLQLRCMTCQNQSIYDSDADFSLQIKKIIKDQIIEAKSEKEIIDFLVSRYGEYIVFKPMLNKKNIFLWVFPFVLFIFSLIIIGMKIKSKN